MAVAFVKNHTMSGNKVAGTTFDLALDTDVPARNLIVLRAVFDNAATSGKPLVLTVTRAAGETATWLEEAVANSTSTSAGAFASGALWCLQTSVVWPAGNYTVTLDTSTVQKAGFFQEFSGSLRTARGVRGTAYSTSTTAASATTTGTAPVIGDLTLGFIFGSNVAAAQAGDNDTTAGSWSTPVGVGTTGGSAATNNYGVGQYKILTAATAQTLNNSATMTAGNGALVVVVQQLPDPTFTQAAYRWYDDGTETGAVALAAQDTPATGDVSVNDGIGQLRVRLQSTNVGSQVATDDYRLQVEKNAGGSWTDVTAASSLARGYNSANLTDGAATTNRLGAGTGSFVAGKVSEDGVVDDLLWTVNNYTELLYSLALVKTDLVNGDTLRFRVLRNGATTGITYSQTPTINVTAVTVVTGTALITQSVDTTVTGTPTVYGTALTSTAVDVTATGVRETFGTALFTITGNASATVGAVITTGTALITQAVTVDVAGTVIAEVVTGTALISSAVETTVTGTPTTFGTAALTESVDVTVAGTVVAEVVTGTALISSSAAITVAGTVVAEVVTGTAAFTSSVAVTVAGTVIAEVVTGTALLSSSVAVTAAGTSFSPGGGTALIAIPLSVTAQGTVVAEVVTGTAAFTMSVAVTAAGARAGTGTALLSSAVAVTAVGTRAGGVSGTALVASSVAITADGTVIAEVVSGTALIASSVTIVVSVLKVYERAPYTATWTLLYSGTLEQVASGTVAFDCAGGWDTNATSTVDHDYAHSWELV